jgi:DNA sulfur modification protein DndC
MEALIEHGEEWLEPLLQYRDLLASTQDPSAKSQVREVKRRDGQVLRKRDGAGVVHGPYKLQVRKELLRRLLEVQKRVRAEGPNPQEELVTVGELQMIRRLWRLEEQDWEDAVPRIHREVTGLELDWPTDDQTAFSGEDRALLEEVCGRHDVPSPMVAKLLDIERAVHGMSRRASIHQRIASVFEEEWRSEKDILAGEFPT